MNWKKVKATREGLVGHQTSIGLTISRKAVFVALPAYKALWKTVAVRYNDQIALAPVLDVGPWNEYDNAYVFGDARPLSESGISLSGQGTNRAGIDLSDGLIEELGYEPLLWDNPDVEWTFICSEDLAIDV